MAASSEIFPKYSTEAYSDESTLNTIEVCLPRPLDDLGLWIVFIHGGAWRDPAISAASFNTTIEKLSTSSLPRTGIAGYASINYRLSPYPSHPTDPSNPSDPARNAKHPDHINDVLAALLYLQEKYRFKDDYVLVAMKRYWGSQYESTFALELNVVPPKAIVGLEGIYDIPAFVKRHEHEPVYRDFITNAFGPSGWDVASPVNGDYQDSSPDCDLIVLAHSDGDQLVEQNQAALMMDALMDQGYDRQGQREVKWFPVTGDHDEVWQTGEAARAVEWAVKWILG
ncbi:hypothetical protein LTR09_011034 [Extremus antarcticus]|uniref:Kynurenine formamidase n=1 Tax=Extremus antarcticus TaxID=702011 RepID=A0AAJ0DCG2_9PEZI|nr:hypothetical protein LTR09_011034 [Extremus antarcticus]